MSRTAHQLSIGRTSDNGRKRCLILSTSNVVGGTEQIVLGLSRELPAHGWNTQSLFPASTSQDTIDWAANQCVRLRTHSAVLGLSERRTLQSILSLQKLVESASVPVVNIHYGANYMSWKDIVGIRLGGRSACVVSIHHPWSWDEIEGGQEKRRATSLASHFVHRIVVTSEAMRDILVEAEVADEKIVVIPCGARPPQALICREDARRQLGISSEAFVISCVGRLVPSKGISDLIEALRQLQDLDRELILVIAGDGPERKELEQRAVNIAGSRVLFLGRVPDLGVVYACADVFVLPSRSEGFGVVFLEAAFHGIPSIGTRVGGIPTAIRDQQTGLLVPVGTPTALADKIRLLHDDPPLRYRLGEAAKQRAYGELTETKMAQRYADVFDDAASSRRQR